MTGGNARIPCGGVGDDALGIRTSHDPDDEENPTCYAALGEYREPDGDTPSVVPPRRRSAVITRDEGRPSRIPGDR